MRKFIVSDLHGNGEVYDSIMAYLENIALIDDVELYINGDLIDRGIDGYRMLEDVKERMEGKGSIKVYYLGGNHELMMYQALLKRNPGHMVNPFCNWLSNGGEFIEGELRSFEDGEEKSEEFKNFLSKLKIVHTFPETLRSNPIVLVHAQVPKDLENSCHLVIGDNNHIVDKAVWTRKEDYESTFFGIGRFLGFNRIGLDGYLTIVGHTPLKDSRGFQFDSKENVFNIDGGCAGYAVGRFEEYDHVPLVEVNDGLLSFLTFNHNNEIIDGYWYDGSFYHMNEEDLQKKRIYLDHSLDGNGVQNRQFIKELYENR